MCWALLGNRGPRETEGAPIPVFGELLSAGTKTDIKGVVGKRCVGEQRTLGAE